MEDVKIKGEMDKNTTNQCTDGDTKKRIFKFSSHNNRIRNFGYLW